MTTSPEVGDNKTENGEGTGDFLSDLTELIPNTVYYVRAYATNSIGTAYGNEKSFKTQAGSAGTITDIDGNIYQTIIIGTQIWMAENLKVTRYNDGTDITHVTDGEDWSLLNSPAYCWHNNDLSNKNEFGALYNWFTVENSLLCPEGWHIPSGQEVEELFNIVGLSVAGIKLRESGSDHWKDCPGWCESTNETGFTAVGSSGREASPNGNFGIIKDSGQWWTTTPGAGEEFAYMFIIEPCTDYVSTPSPDSKRDGKSVRCIRDK